MQDARHGDELLPAGHLAHEVVCPNPGVGLMVRWVQGWVTEYCSSRESSMNEVVCPDPGGGGGCLDG